AQHVRIQVAPVQRGAAELVVGPEPNGDDAGRAGLFLQGPHQPRAPALSLERRIDDQRMELPLKLGMPHGADPTAQGSSFKSAEGKPFRRFDERIHFRQSRFPRRPPRREMSRGGLQNPRRLVQLATPKILKAPYFLLHVRRSPFGSFGPAAGSDSPSMKPSAPTLYCAFFRARFHRSPNGAVNHRQVQVSGLVGAPRRWYRA